MEAKLKQGGTRYDIVFPSESSITKLVNQNLLQKLDHSKIKGLENISPFLLNSPVDKGNQYTIPYFWGNSRNYGQYEIYRSRKHSNME